MGTYIKRTKEDIEAKIQNIIDNRSYDRKLIFITGEYGVGKTELFKIIQEMTKYKNRIIIDLDYSYNMNPSFLRDITLAFVNHIGIMYGKSDKENIKKSTRIAKSILDIIPDVTIGTSGVDINFSKQIELLHNFINNRWESYTESINACDTKGNFYISELVRIIKKISDSCDTWIYLLIDNIDNLDIQTKMFFDEILAKINKIGIIVTSEYDIVSIKNNYALDFLQSFMHRYDNINEDYELELSRFDIQETRTYIEQCHNNLKDINNLTKKINFYSDGLPLFISIICKDKKFISNSDLSEINLKSPKMDIYFRKLVDSYNESTNEILFFLTANNGEIDKNVFDFLCESNSRLKGAVEMLELTNVISLTKTNVCISAPILCKYIEKNVKQYIRFKTKYKTLIYNAYMNVPVVNNISEKYSNIVLLAHETSNNEAGIKYALEGSGILIQQMRPDIAKNILKYTLDKCSPNQEQLNELMCQLIYTLYFCKQMEEVIIEYNKLLPQLINSDYINAKFPLAQLYTAKAYYYLNMPDKAIEVAQILLNNTKNYELFFQCTMLIISSYDLSGNYSECFSSFDNGRKKAQAMDHSLSLVSLFDMVIQMRSSDTNECIHYLNQAHLAFNNPKASRNQACCFNNLGIEYLMNGTFDLAEEYLKKSEAIFTKFHPLESHFVLNNLGLLFQYKNERDEVKANEYFNKAFDFAISPLQKAYILMNLAILSIQEDANEAEELLIQAKVYIDICPDPIAHSYFNYNYAQYYYLNNDFVNARKFLVESYNGLSKPQLNSLYNKRDLLQNKIGKSTKYTREKFTNRRQFFAKLEWEPCELMFYN